MLVNDLKPQSQALRMIIFVALFLYCLDLKSENIKINHQNSMKSIASTLNNVLAEEKADQTSAFRLLDDGHEALLWRIILANQAKESLDMQYFIWKDDRAGKIIMHHLWQAADRGVKIRLLVDDSMEESDPKYLALFSSHPLIEVRLYRPFGPKYKSYLLRWGEFMLNFQKLNRRMHNKLYVTDNKFSVIGGRNIGDEYFEYPDKFVFQSRDLVAIGPVLKNAKEIFNTYWNSNRVEAVEKYTFGSVNAHDRNSFEQALGNFVQKEENYPPGFFDKKAEITKSLLNGEIKFTLGEGELLFDPIFVENDFNDKTPDHIDCVGDRLKKEVLRAKKEVIIESPYLVFLPEVFQVFAMLKKNNVKARILTNSFASNNHNSASAGYKKQRKQMIKTGIELYEYNSNAKQGRQKFATQIAQGKKIKFGIHAKTAVFDDDKVFVGSFNLDPRSIALNTETGLLIKSAELNQQVKDHIEKAMSPQNSWHIELNKNDQVIWVGRKDNGQTYKTDKEPNISIWKRLSIFFLSFIPDNSQL